MLEFDDDDFEEKEDAPDTLAEAASKVGRASIGSAEAFRNACQVIGKVGVTAKEAHDNLSGKNKHNIEKLKKIAESSDKTLSEVASDEISKHMHLNVAFDTMIEGMSNSDYHGFGGLSSTKFPLIDLSVRAFDHRHLFDFAKPVFDEGNLCHDCILLPDLVSGSYIESPTVGLDTLAANAMREDNPGKMVVGQGDIEKYQTLAKIVRLMVPFINFETTKKEVSFFHKHKETGLIFQVRPDIYNPVIGLLYDVKSTKANTPREFMKIIEEYNYDLSIAFYYDVLLLCGYKVSLDYVGWLAVPKSKPNIPFLVRCSQELLEKGRSKYQRLLTKYVDYKKSEKELGKDDANLIYSDIAEKVAHSWEFMKENYV